MQDTAKQPDLSVLSEKARRLLAAHDREAGTARTAAQG
ncbi:hypothetical protein SAMN05444398_11586 [Roseovarius pacificus]|uniref:Uncharacterized protein n=1 Tax=Roseovarius pacificus TaxID=337701 RepID=A0A1M7IHX8_9RHOB|nr:hypothetical protein SAMN05444398_11586 [Roseovarius pacificus]